MASQSAPVSFAATIKPYFTALDRQQMMDAGHTGESTLDLWDPGQVQQNFDSIFNVIDSGLMPPAPSTNPPDSDGPWSNDKIAQFESDFNAWKAGGFQP